ncbi:MAG: histidinol-phosphate transaminase [Bacillota bacterium]
MNNIFRLESLVREDIKGMEPYDAYYAPGIIRMDANENPYDFPEEIKEYIVSRMGEQFFGRYPDPLGRELLYGLAGYFKTGTENIMVGNGSDELILNIMLAFGTGKKIYIATPTFSMYGIHARVAGAFPVSISRGHEFEIDAGAMVEMDSRQPGIIVLCNPNNPTGNADSQDVIEEVVKSVRSLVVVDEAYIEFGGESCVPLLEKYPNLIIMRTFSKAFGLAGMRVGYLLAHKDIVRELMRIKQPFNVNSFSQLAANSVLKFRELFEKQIAEIVSDRKLMEKRLKEMPGIKLLPSVTNFLCFSTERKAGDLYRQLMESGLMIRYIKTSDRGEFLRVSVGTKKENSIFVDRLAAIL